MKQGRPSWCPHVDCVYLHQTQDALCVGQLPSPDPHGEDFNTHRICLHGAKDDGEWTFDLKINRSDQWHIKRLLTIAFPQQLAEGSQP